MTRPLRSSQVISADQAAPLTNAAWLFGSIILVVSLKRRGEVRTRSGFRSPARP